jgi:preprotein translocase subunit SecA
MTQLGNELLNQFGMDLKTTITDAENLNHDQLADELLEKVRQRYEEKEKLFGEQTLRWLERHILLDIVDGQWKDHLLTLDHLKEGIGLRGYGQKDPLVEFKREAFTLFEDMMDRIDTEAVRFLFLVRPAEPGQARPVAAAQAPNRPAPNAQPAGETATPDSMIARQIEQRQRRQQQNLQFQTGPAQAEAPKPVRAAAKVGRNDPCPCGSGKKYKKCHGAAA